MMEDEESSVSQPSGLLRDLEIESFSTGQNLDIEECKELYNTLVQALTSTKSRENEVSNCLELLKDKILEEDTSFQRIQLKESENERNSKDLVSERDSLKERQLKTKQAEMVIKYEYQRVISTNQDLKKQVDSVRLLNEDIVRPVLEKKELELRIVTEESASAVKELSKVRAMFDEVTEQYADVRSTYDKTLSILRKRKVEESHVKKRPHELQGEIELMASKARNIEDELRESRDQVASSQKIVLDETRSREGIERIYKEAMKRLEEQTKRCNKSKDECASISKALSLGQTKYHSLATARVGIEITLKEANEHLRHKKAAALMERKQLDRMMRMYLKKKAIVDKDVDTVETLKLKIAEDTKMIEYQENICGEQNKTIEKMKNDISIKVARLLEHKNIEGEIKNELELIIGDVEDKESEVDQWRTEVKKLRKIISVMKNQHDIQAKKTKATLSDNKETQDIVKLKKFAIMDMNKVLRETNKRTKEFDGFYEALRREKNELMGSLSVSSNTLAEIREKNESDAVHMQSLRRSQEEKRNVLLKEKDSHQSSKSSRATLRVERTNTYAAYREKLEEAERQKSKIDRLQSTICSLQRDIVQLRARNVFLKKRGALVSDQMSQKKVEFHSLLQQANIYEETLKRGELGIEQKKEDLRILQIQCADAERYINAKKSIQGKIKSQREEIINLKGQLKAEKNQIATLSECLENPGHDSDRSRWRDLGGEDLDDEQLFAKKEILLQRLSDNKEQLIEREVELEEISSQNVVVENDIEIFRIKSQPTIKKLNEGQVRVREVTRSMMALVSELSMYQATALKLEEEKETLEEQFSNSRELVSRGQPPSENAQRNLNRRVQKHAEMVDASSDPGDTGIDPRAHENEFGKVYYPAKYALRTTAEPRPSAYIPDVGIEVPKPYGAMAAFKPSDCSFR